MTDQLVLTSFLCCGNTLKGVVTLTRHIIQDHDSRQAVRFSCCGQTFSTHETNWLYHLKTSHGCGDRPLPCYHKTCLMNFEKMGPLRRHVARHHSDIVCCKCHGAPFAGVPQLQEHLMREKGKLKATDRKRQRRRSDDVRLEPIAYSQALQALTQYCDLDREIMTSLVGREAAEPFLYLIEKWPAVLDVPHDTTQTTGLDGTSPIHWRTGNHIQNRSQVLARAIHDMGGKSHATFSSGHIVPLAAPDEQNTSADAKILSLMINPDPESLDLMYAANIPAPTLRLKEL
ncbi:hypothetical protein CC86DRAFT_182897 [Ophiobolus disseminans]|uniref:Uncharacterized protein n=1 Tax=Ophiobolus disseminans TaxID=1469910 RepID=A0A6A6ZCL7_9PLEO|nr:hypothetical protein CC86DRAFT_182897 [Ophiobolus disseminans]